MLGRSNNKHWPPSAELGMDPYYHFPNSHPFLIRITGGHRTYNSGPITTKYSWTRCYHPQDVEDNSKPADMWPPIVSGAKNVDAFAGWSALEVAGNDNVPTDGSAVVLAMPSPSQDFLIFQYIAKRYARIDAKKRSGSTTWFTWTEMEPGPRDASGQTFTVKASGLTGTEETGHKLRNPLFELNQKDVPVGSIVEFWQCPVRLDTSGSDGYVTERPEAVITETVHGDGTAIRQTFRVKWYGAKGGTFKLQVCKPDGTSGITNAIGFTSGASAITTAINAAGIYSSSPGVSVAGNGDFTFYNADTYNNAALAPTVVYPDMWSDTPYFCAFNGSLGDEIFPAKITAKTYSGGHNLYSWTEYEFASLGADATAKSGGRTGTATAWPALEINSRNVPTGVIVWMHKGFAGTPATITVTKTATGNGTSVYAAFSWYLSSSTTGGTYDLFIDGSTVTLNWNDSVGTIKTAIQAATGLTISTVTGVGTSGSPWAFTFTGSAADHDMTGDASKLKNDGDWRFEWADGSEWIKVGSATSGTSATSTDWQYSGTVTIPDAMVDGVETTWTDTSETCKLRNTLGLKITQPYVRGWRVGSSGYFLTDVQGGETASYGYVEDVSWNVSDCTMTKTTKTASYVHGNRMKTV